MAYRPSLRRHRREEGTELNLTPIMNLMVVIIPLLLTSAAFVKLGIIELNLPPAAGAVAGSASPMPKENVRNLELVLSITDNGFYIFSALTAAQKSDTTAPSIPRLDDGGYDFAALSQKLYEIKREAGSSFADGEAIVIQAENKITYQILVSTMDAARSITIDGKVMALFPQVSLSAGII